MICLRNQVMNINNSWEKLLITGFSVCWCSAGMVTQGLSIERSWKASFQQESYQLLCWSWASSILTCTHGVRNWSLTRPCAPKQTVCLWWCSSVPSWRKLFAGHFPSSSMLVQVNLHSICQVIFWAFCSYDNLYSMSTRSKSLYLKIKCVFFADSD